ncbi:MAG TPA: dockerin type I repeat-containing protein [Thermoanaerobaculia bacterium]
MSRLRTALIAVFMVLFSLSAAAQESPGVIASFTGTLGSSGQTDRIGFNVDAGQYELNAAGGVDLVFVMSSENSAQAPVDPGLIAVEATGSGSVQKDMRRPDTASSTTSIALATLTPGTYEIVVRSEHKTTGAYRVDVLLAGDANGDFKVDAADLQVIAQLNATKWDDADYSPYADVDRNGIINGGDRQRAAGNIGAVAPQPQSAENPLDQSLPPGALALVGRSPNAFSSRTGGLRFSLTGAEFDNAPADFTLTVNGGQVPVSALVIEPNLFTANVTLADGRNEIAFKGYDTIGRPLYYKATIWAGGATLRVNLVNANNTAFTQQASVVAALSDDPSVIAEGISTTGSVTFSNLPGRTILIKAKGINNEIGTAGAVGNQGTVSVKMIGFNTPSTIANNDISLGTAGWVIAPGSPVSVIPHTETISGFAKSAPDQQSMKIASNALVDQDLMLGTSGLGERSLSRTFTTEEGTTAVKIRYRFITSEVPGGYFGSQWNDYFRVSLRSQAGGGSANESNSMNGLGLAAFNGAGETDWREIFLAVDRDGDTIQADAAVANVGDGLFQSQVVIDFVEEIKDQVRPALAWNNTQGGLRLTWEVLDRALENDVTIEVYFATGTTHGSQHGTRLFTHVVPAGTQPGQGGPVNIPGADLDDDPAGTTHIIAFSSPTMVGSVADVTIAYGANADAAAVSDRMIDIVKDGLRAAGATTGRITSTARSPRDQARAMFNNCVNNGAASQLALYAAAGDAVIRVYIARTQGLTTAQIRQQAGAIQAAMEAEIVAQGPENVSRHCGDPAVRTVIDVGYSSFNATNRPLFQDAVSGRVSRLIDEPNNSCLHLELIL